MPPASAAARPWWCGRDFRRHQFSSGVRIAGHTAADMERELQRRGLTYTARRFTLEFGQPFLSLDDAQAFFRLYSRDGAVPSRQELAQRLELSAWGGLSAVSAQSEASVPAGYPGGAAEGGNVWIKFSSAVPVAWEKAP